MPDLTTNPEKPLRLFYALWPDDATRDALAHWQETVRGRKINRRNLHLTLAFLGQQPAASVPVLQEILMRLPPTDMTLMLDRAGYFPRAKIAWAGMQVAPDALTGLYRALLQELTQRNIALDQSNFTPHVTLAREATAPPDSSFMPIRWHATQATLMQSVTTPEGVSYRTLASRTLSP